MLHDSTWTEPQNLGEVINTAAEESAPFLASDDKTLYFSSKGFSGYGGADIFVSRRLDDTWTKWSDPENLGPTINSPLEDLFFNIPVSSEFAYYSRGVSETNTDIFRVKLPIVKNPDPWVTVSGKIFDKSSGNPLGAKIIYERLTDGKQLGITQSDPVTGNYEIRLPAGANYGIRAEAEGKLSESQNLDLRNIQNDKSIADQNFNLQPIQVAAIRANESITLNNVFFDFDKWVLKKESYPELNRIVQLMNDTPNMEIVVSGHTDSQGPDEYNLTLSQRRSSAVAKYFTSKGISASRVKSVSFGEEYPVDTNDTAEGRKKNRRVEFKILKL
jgi:OmpA-OmpF porin, OOP family